MASQRSIDRVTSWIHRKVATMLLRDLKDPRVGFLTITRVKVTKDLETATLYYSVLGDEAERSKARHMLDHARSFIQREVAKGLDTRVAPQLRFEFDESIEGAAEMSRKLDELSADRAARDERAAREKPKTEADP